MKPPNMPSCFGPISREGGFGWALMQLLIEYARTEGLKSLFGDVLNENTTMLAMCRELGFTVKSDAREPGISIVSLDLTKGDGSSSPQ
jgi:acetyltransferase